MSTTKLTPDTLVKMLGADRKSVHGGDYQYEVGVWTPEIQDIELRERGYHVVRLRDAAWAVAVEAARAVAYTAGAYTTAYAARAKERVVQIDLLLARLNNAE